MGLFELIIVLLVVLWLLGFGFAGATLGLLVHVLLVLAVVLLLWRLLSGAYSRRGPLDGP